MKNQFTYSRILDAEKNNGVELTLIDTFNMDAVLRTIGLPDGKRVVLLRDVHEHIQEVPVESKAGKIVNYRTQRFTAQTEIILSKEDSERYLAKIEEK